MTTTRQIAVVAALVAAGAAVGLRVQALSQQPAAQAPPAASVSYRLGPSTLAEFDATAVKLSNWGRWGKDDTLGAANLITPAVRKQAAALVKSGISVSLAHDTRATIPHKVMPPIDQGLTLAGSFQLSDHNPNVTHLDALCHLLYKHKAYNGLALTDYLNDQGCAKLSLEGHRNGIVTRGVLIDMPRFRGVPYLEPGTPVYPEDILAWEKKTGVRISSGDMVFLRTGRWVRLASLGAWDVHHLNAGFHPSVAPLFKERGVTFVGQDGPEGIQPLEFAGVKYPFHQIMMVALGVAIIDNIDAEPAAAKAAELNRWSFLVTMNPLPIHNATGIPVNPVATW